jgi:hypothetical protein
MRSLHISSPNSVCNAGVHGAFAESGESSKVLDMRLRFETGSVTVSPSPQSQIKEEEKLHAL